MQILQPPGAKLLGCIRCTSEWVKVVSSRPRQVMTSSLLALLWSRACRMSACQPQSSLPASEGCQIYAGGHPGLLAAVLRSHLLPALLLG